jgi:putative ABC transport system substrate-binding protein
MRRREFIAVLGGAAAWPTVARGQQAARYRVGHLAIAAPTDIPPPPPANWDGFVQGLRESGYVEGRTSVSSIEPRTISPTCFLNSQPNW